MQVFLDKTGGNVLHFCEHSVIIACNDSNYQKVHYLIDACRKIEFWEEKMKKRVLSLLLVLLMVVSLVPISALADKSNTDVAYAVEGGNIYFDKATGTITDCDDGVTEAIIPAEIGGVKVTSIGEGAFSRYTSLMITSY